MTNDTHAAEQTLVDPRVFYLVPGDEGGKVGLVDLFVRLWSSKWWIVLTGFVFAILGVVYSLLATEWYRAEVVVLPATAQGAPALTQELRGIGGLTALAGIGLGGEGTTASLAVLRSRELAKRFIEEHDLMPVLLEDQWNAETNSWKVEDGTAPPDVRDAIKRFRDEALEIQDDTADGTILIAVEWTDPVVATDWANALVANVNARMREDAMREARTNVEYLTQQLGEVGVTSVRAGMARILEQELQKLTLAAGRTEFAFDVIDPAMVPKNRERPRRTMIVLLAGFFGAVLAAFVVVLRAAWSVGQE